MSSVTAARPLVRQPTDLAPPKLCDGALPAAEILAHSGRTPLALVRPDASLASLAAAASLARKRDLPQVGGNGSTCPCVSSQSLRRPRTSRHAGTARNAGPSGGTCRWCSSRSRPRRRPRLLRVPFPHRWQGKPCPHLVAAPRECELMANEVMAAAHSPIPRLHAQVAPVHAHQPKGSAWASV